MERIVGMLAGALLVACSAQALAQQPATEKKLYCWNEGGRKVCGDALPASAVDSERTELSLRSGRPVGALGRALTPEERAVAEENQRRAGVAANAEAATRRREQAMVESYATEADLRRAFDDRIVLVDEGLKTSQLGVANLRQSLVSLLRQASELELQGKPVDRSLSGSIRAQHNDLLRQLAIMRQQQQERASLDSELEHAVERYHALKAAKPG